jgi:hypothetical protein
MAKRKNSAVKKVSERKNGIGEKQDTLSAEEVNQIISEEAEQLEEHCRSKRNATYKRLHNGLDKSIETLEKIRDGVIKATPMQRKHAAQILLNKVLPDRTYKELSSVKNEKTEMEIRLTDLTEEHISGSKSDGSTGQLVTRGKEYLKEKASSNTKSRATVKRQTTTPKRKASKGRNSGNEKE